MVAYQEENKHTPHRAQLRDSSAEDRCWCMHQSNHRSPVTSARCYQATPAQMINGRAQGIPLEVLLMQEAAGEPVTVGRSPAVSIMDCSINESTVLSGHTSTAEYQAKYLELELGQGGFGSVYAGNRRSNGLPRRWRRTHQDEEVPLRCHWEEEEAATGSSGLSLIQQPLLQ
ncbi:unnamed protein product [Pleuronectes platessa]|uniref:Uncharacterized protein n=1 Tax=Pleuronectes platessa TaxID=8262 RepID=A0A9N7VS25_PLEPL|nr:unnamed protein product [Pleuronectes platessa]